MKKLFIPLVFAVLMITACSGEYNKTFKMAYEKANTIETDSYITWKMIESSASSPEDVLDLKDLSLAYFILVGKLRYGIGLLAATTYYFPIFVI